MEMDKMHRAIRYHKIYDYIKGLKSEELQAILLSKSMDVEFRRTRADELMEKENARMHKVFELSAVFFAGMAITPFSMAVVGEVVPGPAAVGLGLGMCAFAAVNTHAFLRNRLTEVSLYEYIEEGKTNEALAKDAVEMYTLRDELVK